jgi:hypothetical protein
MLWWILGSLATLAVLVYVAYKHPTVFNFWKDKAVETAKDVEDKFK